MEEKMIKKKVKEDQARLKEKRKQITYTKNYHQNQRKPLRKKINNKQLKGILVIIELMAAFHRNKQHEEAVFLIDYKKILKLPNE